MMKNRLFVILLTFSLVALNAQNTEHLKFKGVPIDGTLEMYTENMKLNGFNLESSQNGTAIFTGDFAGFKDCKLGVSTLNQKNLVYKIGVLFPNKQTWSDLNGDFQKLKSMLTEKYGKPTDEQEKFDSEYGPVDDNNRIHQVKFDKCKYISFWQTTNGTIQLSIDHISVTSCFVKLDYFDKINGDIIKAKAIDDL